MKKFQFRLQKVKELREEVEKQKMLEMAEAQNLALAEEKRLQSYYTEKDECYKKLEEFRGGEKIDCVEIRLCYDFIKRKEKDIEYQKLRIAKVYEEVERRRLILMAAAKERKILDNLKERQQKLYLTEIARKEQAMLDDLTITHFSPER